MSKENNVQEQLPINKEKVSAPVYTEEQVREIYAEGHTAGYIAAVKRIRNDVIDYLNDLIISANINPNN